MKKDIVSIVAANHTALYAALERLDKRLHKQREAAFQNSGMLELNARHQKCERDLEARHEEEHRAWMDDDSETMECPSERHRNELHALWDSLWPERDRVQTHHESLSKPIYRRYALARARARIKAARELVEALA